MTRRALKITLLVLIALGITGCGFVADGPLGWVYTDTIVPITVGKASSGAKEGKACIHSIFGAISIGDASIEAAMEDAGINEIYTVNKENLSIIGTYTRQCTVVKGE